ncbi:MAG: (2Fe-2S)-binding protein [Bacillota bacterium]|jgi:aerobic-type carbon monoxide dehydrogenase small subunit (CoxS/CutS family)
MGTIEFSAKVNGKTIKLQVPPNIRLIDLLRDYLGLTGTKEACGEGECGACTVLVDGEPVNSCLMFALQARGKEILTIEGLGTFGQLHPLQTAFLEHGAVQCGFCTPGMLLSAKALLDKNPNPTRNEIKTAISGNLCRCTGYTKIVEAIESVVRGGKTE